MQHIRCLLLYFFVTIWCCEGCPHRRITHSIITNINNAYIIISALSILHINLLKISSSWILNNQRKESIYIKSIQVFEMPNNYRNYFIIANHYCPVKVDK